MFESKQMFLGQLLEHTQMRDTNFLAVFFESLYGVV